MARAPVTPTVDDPCVRETPRSEGRRGRRREAPNVRFSASDMTDQPPSSFLTIPGAAASPWILHVPHSSTRIPRSVRESIALDDDELAAELAAMTDAHTDLLARRICESVRGRRPWMFVNRLSRLVVDPERFPDGREVMNSVGMGAVYTHTSTGKQLRADNPSHRAELITALYEPYGRALADLVDDRLAAAGSAVILDLHSYPRDPLPYELYPHDERPVTCLGTDDDHTPTGLVEAVREAFASLGSVAVNQPFRGAYVPLRHYRREDRVSSLMLELRRDAYLRHDGSPIDAAIERVAQAAARLLERFPPRT
jgi:N-formylglutamate deformylase